MRGPTLIAVLAITTGILGAVLARFVLNGSGGSGGSRTGIASHGNGTARAFSINAEAGRFASLGTGLHGIPGAQPIPLLFR